MRKYLASYLALITILLSGCTKEPAVEHKLTAEQLAWQPYRSGDVLRFGHDKDSKVRTYRITEVHDRLETQYQGGSWLPLPQKKSPLYQYVTVRVQRTDTTSLPLLLLDMYLYNDQALGSIELRTEVEWETLYGVNLPLDAVNAGVPIDTLNHPGTKLLPTVRLGPTTYSQVLLTRNRYTSSALPGTRLTRNLYYARSFGVVAFTEDGTGLWYRLP